MRKTCGIRHLALAAALVCMALQRPMGLALRLIFPYVDSSAESYYAAVLIQQAFLWLLPACFMRPWRVKRLGPREPLRWLAMLALPAGLLTQLGLCALEMPFARGGTELPLPESGAGWALCVLAVALAPALCEEAFFRGALLTHLMDTASPVTAFAGSTLAFALMHASLPGLVPHLAISALCTLFMMFTGRVWLAMLCHLGFNAMALAAAFMPRAGWMPLTLLFPLALLILLARGMRWKGEGRRMGKTDTALLALLLALEAARYL